MKACKSLFLTLILSLNITIIRAGEDQAMREKLPRKERIIKTFNELRKDNLHILDNFYHQDLEFIDPVHSLKGLDAIKKYYANMYENVTDIRFDFKQLVEEENQIIATWDMTLTASGLNGGEPVIVAGNSHVTFDPETDLVIYHRDYFDMGAFIYEHVPVLGRVIQYIKKKLGHQ